MRVDSYGGAGTVGKQTGMAYVLRRLKSALEILLGRLTPAEPGNRMPELRTGQLRLLE